MNEPQVQFSSAAKLAKFPGMFPPEVPILRRWIELHQGDYDAVQFNVRVGTGFDPGPGVHQAIRDMAIANTRLRIDAVVWKGQQATLVEVKQHAGASSLGQLLTYSQLWQEANPGAVKPILLVVTADHQPDIPRVLAAWGVKLEVVTP